MQSSGSRFFAALCSIALAVIAKPSLAEEYTPEQIAAFMGRGKATEVWQPAPPQVRTGELGSPPSDATVLFGGSNTSSWEAVNGGEIKWQISNGALQVAPGSGSIQTREKFSSVQLHLEWRSPSIVQNNGQDRGNSGVILMERYEVQILDSFNNPTYANGQAASIYKQHIPLVNASKEPGAWQTYDIVFMAPAFDESGQVVQPATLTVFHNGVLAQNNVSVKGSTTFIGQPSYKAHGAASIVLQDHRSPVQYRNIWVRRL